MSIEKDRIRISFNHTNGGLKTKNGEKITGFAIAGSDKTFYWGGAEKDGETVVVYTDKVSNPVSVRYAWAANPVCNLYNKAGLPASPFRTDSWPGLT